MKEIGVLLIRLKASSQFRRIETNKVLSFQVCDDVSKTMQSATVGASLLSFSAITDTDWLWRVLSSAKLSFGLFVANNKSFI